MTLGDQLARNARALELATLYPFVVTIHGQREGKFTVLIREVVQAPMHAPPIAEDFVPEGCVVGRADIFPASRFDDMSLQVRARYRSEYQEYLMWRKAWSLQKPRAELVPWVDYDCILLEGNVARWAKGLSA